MSKGDIYERRLRILVAPQVVPWRPGVSGGEWGTDGSTQTSVYIPRMGPLLALT